MFKLIGAAVLAAAAIACGTKSDTGSNNSQPHPDSVSVSGGGGTTFSLVMGHPETLSANSPAPTAAASDSVVVIGGQQCVATVNELLPATTPPKYRVVVKC